MVSLQLVQTVDEMYDTYQDYGGKAELKDQVQLDTLHEEIAITKARLEEVYDWICDRSEEMVCLCLWVHCACKVLIDINTSYYCFLLLAYLHRQTHTHTHTHDTRNHTRRWRQ